MDDVLCIRHLNRLDDVGTDPRLISPRVTRRTINDVNPPAFGNRHSFCEPCGWDPWDPRNSVHTSLNATAPVMLGRPSILPCSHEGVLENCVCSWHQPFPASSHSSSSSRQAHLLSHRHLQGLPPSSILIRQDVIHLKDDDDVTRVERFHQCWNTRMDLRGTVNYKLWAASRNETLYGGYESVQLNIR